MDEVGSDDQVFVLHHGKVLASGRTSDVVKSVGAKDISGAFTQLTGETVKGKAA